MAYCSKCGEKNLEGSKYCGKCGASLEGVQETKEERFEKSIEASAEQFGERMERWGEDFGKRAENECFGLPHGGAILGLFIGALIVLWGMTQVFDWDIELGTFATIAFGLLILTGAVYSFTKRR